MLQVPRSGMRFALVVLVLVVVTGCAGLDPARIPPIDTAGTQPMPGKVIWHDLLTEDPAAARRFYGGLFGWHFRQVGLGLGQNYTVIEHNGRVIGGLVDGRRITRNVNVSRWIPVLSVADMAVAIAATEAAGGTVFQAPLVIPQRGTVAVIGDPQGAVLTLFESRDGDPADRVPETGDWLWNEIWSSDPDATLAFYRSLVPAYETDDADDARGGTYRYLSADGVPRVGVLPNPVAGITDTWMAYVRVPDPTATAAAAEALGGEILLPAQRDPRGGEIAILNDPTGAGFLIQSWTPDPEHTVAR